MENILNQEEIDALFQASHKGEISGASARVVQLAGSKFHLREISQINKDQVRARSTLDESFARHVSKSLGAKDVRVVRSGKFIWIRMQTSYEYTDILLQSLSEVH